MVDMKEGTVHRRHQQVKLPMKFYARKYHGVRATGVTQTMVLARMEKCGASFVFRRI